ncbi:hypothetical protein DMENIID0001_005550 [Sergentomyia squamirostris]
MSALPIIVKQNSPSVGLFTHSRERELGLDRRETVNVYVYRSVLCETRFTESSSLQFRICTFRPLNPAVAAAPTPPEVNKAKREGSSATLTQNISTTVTQRISTAPKRTPVVAAKPITGDTRASPAIPTAKRSGEDNRARKGGTEEIRFQRTATAPQRPPTRAKKTKIAPVVTVLSAPAPRSTSEAAKPTLSADPPGITLVRSRRIQRRQKRRSGGDGSEDEETVRADSPPPAAPVVPSATVRPVGIVRPTVRRPQPDLRAALRRTPTPDSSDTELWPEPSPRQWQHWAPLQHS